MPMSAGGLATRREFISAGLGYIMSTVLSVAPRLRSGSSIGFTMLEVVVVLVILGVLASVAVSRFQVPDADLPARADVIAAHLRYAQYRAMNSDVSFGLYFEGDTYYLYDDGNLANTHSLPGEEGLIVDLGADGYSITADGGDTFFVVFDSWGVPYTSQGIGGGAAAVQNGDRTLTLSKGGENRAIVVTAETGYVP